MKGVILAGGKGTRLFPTTRTVNKHLLPIYDKPLIYYPIATLMLAGVRDLMLIADAPSLREFKKLLGDGSAFGISLKYEVQSKPNGIAEALIISQKFLNKQPCSLILGDNIFHGLGLGGNLENLRVEEGARIFTYEVSDPSRYGILNADKFGSIKSIQEKPVKPSSNKAITGLYFFDSEAPEIAKSIKPSKRNELEITSVLNVYLNHENLRVTALSRGICWMDAGTPDSMHDASNYVKVIEQRTGLKIACLEEIAFRNNWIDRRKLIQTYKNYNNSYGDYLFNLAKTFN